MKKSTILIILSIVSVAVLGTIFTQIGMAWFEGLIKPTEWIPSFIIPIIWTIIYLLFVYILIKWQSRRPINQESIVLLILNGILNVLWCFVFFTLSQLFLGNILIIINALFGLRLYLEICKNDAMNGLLISIYPTGETSTI